MCFKMVLFILLKMQLSSSKSEIDIVDYEHTSG